MELHAPTLILSLALAFGTLALSLTVVQVRLPGGNGLRRWTIGNWCLFGGFGILVLRDVLPVAAVVILGNGLVIAGVAIYAQAVDRFILGRPANVALRITLIVTAALALAGSLLEAPLRVVLFSVLLALPMLRIAAAVWRRRDGIERSMILVGATMALTSVALLARAGHALLEPAAYANPVAGNAPALVLLFILASQTGCGFAFILANVERAGRHLENLATQDRLTGCVNRAAAEAMINHALHRGRRELNPLALLALDIDHFKRINDGHGHPVGDEVLRRLAAEVRSRLRASDIFARMGGEEFAIMLPATPAAGARLLAEKLRRAVEAMAISGAGGAPVPVSVSIGVAVVEQVEAMGFDELYARADRALYQAKAKGRNCVSEFDLASEPEALRAA